MPIVEAVGVATSAKDPVLAQTLERAMSAAIERAIARNLFDPAVQRAMMMAGYAAAKAGHAPCSAEYLAAVDAPADAHDAARAQAAED